MSETPRTPPSGWVLTNEEPAAPPPTIGKSPMTNPIVRAKVIETKRVKKEKQEAIRAKHKETQERQFIKAQQAAAKVPTVVNTPPVINLPPSAVRGGATDQGPPDKLLTAAMARLAERIKRAQADPIEFVEFVMRTPEGHALKLQWFHKEWLSVMKNGRRVLVEAPRGHGKTTLTIGFALWMLGNNPNLRIKFVCQNDEKAKERLYEFRQNIEGNPILKLVFPNLRQAEVGEWTKSKLYVERTAKTRDPSFEAIGILGSATGGRIDVLFCDDVCDLRNSILYPSMREDIKQKFHGEFVPTMAPEGKIIYICTPYHNADLTAVLKKNSEWMYKHYGVGNDDDPLAPLWPEYWTRELLAGKRREMGSIEFDRAYRCIALSGETVPCKPNWIQFYDANILGDPNQLICVQGYDLAISQKTSADYFACVTLLFDPNRGLVFVADAYQGRYSFAEQGQQVIQNAMRWKPDKILIERVGLGGGLESFLEEKSPIKLPMWPYIPKGDKQKRFLETTPVFEDMRIYFHPNLDPQKNVLIGDRGDLVGQLLEFPLGLHDDLVDAFVVAMSGLIEFRLTDPEEGWADGENTRVRLSVIGG